MHEKQRFSLSFVVLLFQQHSKIYLCVRFFLFYSPALSSSHFSLLLSLVFLPRFHRTTGWFLFRVDGNRFEFLSPRFQFYGIALTPDSYQRSCFLCAKLLALAYADAVNYVLKVLTFVCLHISQLRAHCWQSRYGFELFYIFLSLSLPKKYYSATSSLDLSARSFSPPYSLRFI